MNVNIDSLHRLLTLDFQYRNFYILVIFLQKDYLYFLNLSQKLFFLILEQYYFLLLILYLLKITNHLYFLDYLMKGEFAYQIYFLNIIFLNKMLILLFLFLMILFFFLVLNNFYLIYHILLVQQEYYYFHLFLLYHLGNFLQYKKSLLLPLLPFSFLLLLSFFFGRKFNQFSCKRFSIFKINYFLVNNN